MEIGPFLKNFRVFYKLDYLPELEWRQQCSNSTASNSLMTLSLAEIRFFRHHRSHGKKNAARDSGEAIEELGAVQVAEQLRAKRPLRVLEVCVKAPKTIAEECPEFTQISFVSSML